MAGRLAMQAGTTELRPCSPVAGKAFQAARTRSSAPCRRPRTACAASADSEASLSRRGLVQLAGAVGVLTGTELLKPPPSLAKKGGFVPVNDQGDAYKFVYPFGWQEVSVTGQDVVYKDIIEPLESVSVNLVPTDKDDITLFGSPEEVAATLADNVLTSAKQQTKVLMVKPYAVEGRNYVNFEFAANSGNFIRRAIAVVTVANGKLYTLVTGANERRWDKMKDQLETVAQSFVVNTKYSG